MVGSFLGVFKLKTATARPNASGCAPPVWECRSQRTTTPAKRHSEKWEHSAPVDNTVSASAAHRRSADLAFQIIQLGFFLRSISSIRFCNRAIFCSFSASDCSTAVERRHFPL